MHSKLIHRENVLPDGRVETEREEIYDDNGQLIAILGETPVERKNYAIKIGNGWEEKNMNISILPMK